MKRYAIWIVLLVVCAGAAVMAKKRLNDTMLQETKQQDESAAFRDGLYLGKFAAARGDAAHVATGRWAGDSDRAQFAAGYEQAFGDAAASANAKSGATAIAAYRDGLYMGKRDSENGDDPHVAVARWSQASHRAAFTEGYNLGYKNGESARESRNNVRLAQVINKEGSR
jgi:hypothetical protein